MIAIDTNVLLRYLLADDSIQTPRAIRLIEEATERGEPVLISQIVLCETEWVLDTTYGASRREIYGILKRLLGSEPFVVEEAERAGVCLEIYRERQGDLSDFLLGAAGRASGATTTFTFDRKLRREPDFTPL
jgi:predicted nucleic-acid-binding protein